MKTKNYWSFYSNELDDRKSNLPERWTWPIHRDFYSPGRDSGETLPKCSRNACTAAGTHHDRRPDHVWSDFVIAANYPAIGCCVEPFCSIVFLFAANEIRFLNLFFSVLKEEKLKTHGPYVTAVTKKNRSCVKSSNLWRCKVGIKNEKVLVLLSWLQGRQTRFIGYLHRTKNVKFNIDYSKIFMISFLACFFLSGVISASIADTKSPKTLSW